MNFTVKKVVYEIARDPVTIVTQHRYGQENFHSTQPALTARCAPPNTVWGDAETVAEVQAQLDAKYPGEGHTAVANT